MSTEAHAIVDVLLENEEFASQAAQAAGTTQECAWCNTELGLEPTPGASHCICKRHWLELMRQMGRPEGEIQAKLSDPSASWVPERTRPVSAV